MTVSREAWIAALGMSDVVCDQDALTTAELGELFGRKHSATKVRIRQLVAEGKLIATRKRMTDSTGRPIIVPAYQIAKPKATKPRR